MILQDIPGKEMPFETLTSFYQIPKEDKGPDPAMTPHRHNPTDFRMELNVTSF